MLAAVLGRYEHETSVILVSWIKAQTRKHPLLPGCGLEQSVPIPRGSTAACSVAACCTPPLVAAVHKCYPAYFSICGDVQLGLPQELDWNLLCTTIPFHKQHHCLCNNHCKEEDSKFFNIVVIFFPMES